jgi:PAS domain S-box-containing protein/putative nucleotidyltransferase with HDIG domain
VLHVRKGSSAVQVPEFDEITVRKRVSQALDNAFEFFRTAMKNASDLITLLDDKGTIVYQSSSIERILGQVPEQLQGTSLRDLIHPDDMQQATYLLESVWEYGGKTVTCQLRAKHKDGSWRSMEATAQNLLLDPVIGGIVVNWHDITKMMKIQGELEESESNYRLLAQSLPGVTWTLDTNFRYAYLNPSVSSLLGYSVEEATALSMEEATSPTSLQAVLRVMGEAAAKEGIGANGEPSSVALELEITRKDGSTVWVDNRISCLRDPEGRPTGYLGFSRDITESRGAGRRLEQCLQKLDRTLDGAIQAIAQTVECRDTYAADHHRRVAQVASAIAKEMGFSSDQVRVVRAAALLHDIGMLAVPQEILNKPGKLNVSEFNLVKTHCQTGYDILKHVEFPWPIADIVIQHHERMNGSGYPSGIKEGEIILEARILGVADVVEAMNSYRSYRAPLGVDKTLRQISRKRGVLYDPTVVDACVRLFTEKGFEFETEEDSDFED